jgi:DNA-binding CsgD family transcriptional regulator
MQLLMPHLRRACLLHQRLTRLRAERAGSFGALELLPTAVWLINVDGRLQHANRAGRELDARHDGLWVGCDGRPTAADPGDRERLQRCIAATIAAGNGLGLSSDGALLVRRRSQAQPLQVMLYPLGRDALLAGSAAAMFIVDPASSPVPDAELLIALYALTPAEARLACALARGVSVKEYGLAHRVTANTVRTHLKQVMAKTGTTRQSQLAGLVARLAARRGD